VTRGYGHLITIGRVDYDAGAGSECPGNVMAALLVEMDATELKSNAVSWAIEK
jgi:hypothetical protein